MFLGVEVDGRTLVILHQHNWGFRAVVSGEVSFDGQTLILRTEAWERIISDDQLGGFQLVTAHCHIPECRGFDFFLIENP